MRSRGGATRPVSISTHYQQAKRTLTELVIELAEEGEARLPAEDRLSEVLGFSRPTIRSALHALQQEGKVQRLHGVGTLINRHALDVAANLAEDRPFLDLLARLGFEPSIDIESMGELPMPADAAGRLGVEEGSPACVITRVFMASGAPAVLSRDYVPMAYLPTAAGETSPERSTFAFLKVWAGSTVRYSVTAIRPVNPGQPVTRLLGLPDEAPLLLLDHLHIDSAERPIAVTAAYVNTGYVPFTVIRSGIDL